MNLKILKLRSGEEIACEVLEENESNIKIHRPMIFKTMSSYDPMGRSVEVISLHDWLMTTDIKDIDLPMNHIVFMTNPNSNTQKLYEMESVREFDSKTTEATIEDNTPKDKMTDADLFGSFLEDFIKSSVESIEDQIADIPPPPKRKKRKNKKSNYLPPDMTDENELDRHMIMMQLYVPSESIMNLVSSGIISPKVLQDMLDEVKKRNRFTGDEKENKNFGNRFSDWNPDPNSDDYK
jgi:hypothetical protein